MAYASSFSSTRDYTDSYLRSTESKLNSHLQVIWLAVTALQGQVESLEETNLQLEKDKITLEKRVCKLKNELEDIQMEAANVTV